jgi:hypothetical protein
MVFEGISNSFFFASFLLCAIKKYSRKDAEPQRFQLARLLLAFMSKKSTHVKPIYRRQGAKAQSNGFLCGFPTLRE